MVDDRRSDRDAHEPRAGSDSVRAARTLVDRGEVDVVVSDLDGVLRVFDDGLWDRLDRELGADPGRSEEHTSELQSRGHLVCRLLLEKKKNTIKYARSDDQSQCRRAIA